MQTLVSTGVSKILKVTVNRGELLLESIIQAACKEGVTDGYVASGIGTFDKLVYHRVTSFAPSPEEEFITIEEPMELSSVQGVIADGIPHLHIVASDLHQTVSGHLEPGSSILYLAEIVIVETPGSQLIRRRDANNINCLQIKASN